MRLKFVVWERVQAWISRMKNNSDFHLFVSTAFEKGCLYDTLAAGRVKDMEVRDEA